ncbi:MFS transporter [Cupriavidus necator]|uniref:hypothetical protein n=1 Tax=Cupriavidus necator TaxID=106590 RepID=UPI0009B64334|nr:hypothetical protein [Cupriavidus necator]MDX6007392.1 hypothetical protein [Cupriavidus necator]
MVITGLTLVVLAETPAQALPIQVALIMCIGFMLKMPTPLVSSYLTEILPLQKAIPAVGVVVGGGSFLGQFLGPLIVGYAKAHSTGFSLSFVILGCLGIVGGLLIMAAKSRRTAAASVALSSRI